MAARPHTRPRSPALRRLTAVAVIAAPAVLLLGAPATAAPAVVVTPLADACGLAVDVSGLADGPHVLVVRTTVLATGAGVPVVEDDHEDEQDPTAEDPTAQDPAAAEDPTAQDRAAAQDPTAQDPATEEPAEPSLTEPRLEAVLTVDGGAAAEDTVLEVALDGSAVPDDEPWVRVSLEIDDAVLSVADLELTACGDAVDPSPSPSPSPSATPSGSPSATPSTDPSPSVTPTASAEPTESASATPTPSTTVIPTPTLTPSPSVPRTRTATSASPSVAPLTPVAATDPLLTGPVRTEPAPTEPVRTEPVPTAPPISELVLAAADVRAPLGTGTSGYRLLALSTPTTPQTDTVPVVAPVPDPVVAPLDGVPAGSLVDPGPDPSPLASLLPALPARDAPAQRRTLASAPDLPVGAAGDPLVALAPAGFVLAASFGGLLMAGRRRGS